MTFTIFFITVIVKEFMYTPDWCDEGKIFQAFSRFILCCLNYFLDCLKRYVVTFKVYG